MKLPLRKVDVMNSYDPLVSVVSAEDLPNPSIVPTGFSVIIDAETNVVAFVPSSSYKDWNHSETICELLNWAAENYPYRVEEE